MTQLQNRIEGVGIIKYVNEEIGHLRSNVMPNILMTSLIVLSSFTPLLSRLITPYAKLLLILLWILTAISLKRPTYVRPARDVVFWWSAYIVLVFFTCIIGHSDISINFYISNLTRYCVPFMMLVVLQSYNLKEKKLLWLVITGIFVVNLLQNILYGVYHPDYFEGLDGLDATRVEKRTNAGGTGFVVLCLFSVIIWWMINQFSLIKKNRLVSIVFAGLCVFYMIFLNNRTTALLVLAIEIMGFILIHRAKDRKLYSKKKIIVSVVIIIAIIGYFAIPILETLINFLNEESRMADRFIDLLSVAEGVDPEMLPDGSLAQRYILWMTSINTFFASIPNFLFGIGDDDSLYDMASLIKSGIGRHSEFFDLAAKYGLIGIVVFYKAWSSTFRLFSSICNSYYMKSLLSVFIVSFIVYSFVNQSPSSLLVMIFLPLTMVLLKQHLI